MEPHSKRIARALDARWAPRLADEEVRPVTFKLPVSKIIALDCRAAARGGTRSEALREAVDAYLADD